MEANHKPSLNSIFSQIDKVLALWNSIQSSAIRGEPSQDSKYYQIDLVQSQEILTLLITTIERLAPTASRYLLELELAINHSTDRNNVFTVCSFLDRLAGILKALRSDYAIGYLQTVQELIHADLFSDFLEMADYFLKQGFKGPAAVMAGSILEEHLRKLCHKNNLPIEDTTSNGVQPKRADKLNSDLAGRDIYPALDQKNVTAWLALRNKAAHGKYGDYQIEQVRLMVQGIRDFLARLPA